MIASNLRWKDCNYVEFGCRDSTPPAYGQFAFRSRGKVWLANPFAEKVTVPTRSDGTVICQDPSLLVVVDCEKLHLDTKTVAPEIGWPVLES